MGKKFPGHCCFPFWCPPLEHCTTNASDWPLYFNLSVSIDRIKAFCRLAIPTSCSLRVAHEAVVYFFKIFWTIFHVISPTLWLISSENQQGLKHYNHGHCDGCSYLRFRCLIQLEGSLHQRRATSSLFWTFACEANKLLRAIFGYVTKSQHRFQCL